MGKSSSKPQRFVTLISSSGKLRFYRRARDIEYAEATPVAGSDGLMDWEIGIRGRDTPLTFTAYEKDNANFHKALTSC